MNIELPEGTHVQILIAPSTTGLVHLDTQPTVSPPAVASGPRHRVLKGTMVLTVVGLAFLAGERVSPHGHAAPVAQAQGYSVPSPPPSPNGIPPAFRQQLEMPPKVTPAPGAAAPAAKAGEDGFGLEN